MAAPLMASAVKKATAPTTRSSIADRASRPVGALTHRRNPARQDAAIACGAPSPEKAFNKLLRVRLSVRRINRSRPLRKLEAGLRGRKGKRSVVLVFPSLPRGLRSANLSHSAPASCGASAHFVAPALPTGAVGASRDHAAAASAVTSFSTGSLPRTSFGAQAATLLRMRSRSAASATSASRARSRPWPRLVPS